MKSVGEVMAIGRTFQQAFAKAMRSRELDIEVKDDGDLLERLEIPGADRFDVLLEAFRQGATQEEVHARTSIDPWFLRELHELALDPEGPFRGVRTFKAVDTCAAEFAAETPYYYSAWERQAADEVRRGDKPSVMILGSGPNRIGQGIEFDYCCVHAAMTVRESGRDAVMVNCNPETVSTDYDTSDRLYFEPLTLEDVLGIVEVEQPEGVIVQFGGQTPLRLAAGLEEAGVPLLGTQPEAIDLAEDRGRFGALLGRARAEGAGVRDRALRGGGAGGRAARRLPAARAPELRARRPRDGDRLLARRARGLPAARRARLARARDLPRPLPGERGRGRRRRDLRRRGRLDRRRHAARRGGRHPLGRLGLRAAAALARARDARRDRRVDAAARARARLRRADERAVRGARRRPLRDRGQPARVADGAVRLQGDRDPAGQDRVPGDAGREARGAGPARRPAAATTSRSRRR